MARSTGPGDSTAGPTAIRDADPGDRGGKALGTPFQSPLPEGGAGRPPLGLWPERRRLREPVRRDPTAVLDNVLDGLISSEIAREHYGVVIANGTVDAAETEKLRQARN